MIEDSPAFDVRGPLPRGVTVLEASAGTGKTYTIAALAARYVAEGTPLSELLLVSFTRLATGELRERVRERLVSAEQGLEAALGAVARPLDGADELVEHLASAPREEVQARRDRLARALGDFDSATIATTHGFCQEVLGSLGVAGDLERDGVFVESVDDLIEEVVDDLYVRRFAPGGETLFDPRQALEIARMAVANFAAPIEPSSGSESGAPAMRRRFAAKAREEVEKRKRRLAVMTYDDLLTRLSDVLARDGGGVAAARLRARYSVVLVDEFQDTDPVQWDILRRAFGGSEAGALVLIGDPKQAIYAFRGADVYAYLQAASSAPTRATLRTNWRSDQKLLDAYDALFGGAKLGHEGIAYRTVQAAEANRRARLTGAPAPEPLRVRLVHRTEPSITLTRGGFATTDAVREHIASDLAADLVSLLSSKAHIDRRGEDGADDPEPIRPGDIAVLVRKHRTAALIREALDAVGIPAAINGAGSVFATTPALEWLRLLEAIERPAFAARAHSAALTSFMGWRPERVARAQDAEWEEVHGKLHQWGAVLRTKGVAALLATVSHTEELPRRVLEETDGERRLTDLRHVGHLLHAAAAAEQLGTTALTSWLRRRVAEAQRDSSDEERSRRLESDAEAVQILTIHRSKGLEFGVVYCPDLWDPTWVPDQPLPVAYHDPDRADRRTIDVGLQGPAYERHKRQSIIEQRGEDLRLAYVALTRAQHQAVVWWAGSYSSRHSSLGRLLFAKDADGNIAPFGAATPSDAEAQSRFETLAARAPGCIGVERSSLAMPATWTGEAREARHLSCSRFDRPLDSRWRRTSYSDITAQSYEARVGSEPEDTEAPDDALELSEAPRAAIGANAGASAPRDVPLAVPLPLAVMPAGVHIGTFVHRVLEATDFAAPDLDAEVGSRVGEALARRNLDLGDRDQVVAGLRAAIETPLGPVLGGLRLRDVKRADRLDELDFELPLVGGDTPTGRLAVAAIGEALRRHLPANDPLAEYADRLDDPSLRESVRGYLTGSIDLVVRSGGAPGGRFAVLDYKTNRLAPIDDELTAWHYRPATLAAEMRAAHYGLQALLYGVALHRYLRWRLPGYDPERNLGGVAYLFLRGMIGSGTPHVDGSPCGVFGWRPPAALVEALSDTLDSGMAA